MSFSFGKVAIAILAVATALFGVTELSGPNGYTQLMQKREQVHALELENRKLRSDVERLERRVDRLTHDPEAQDLAARKGLGVVAPTDKVYVFQGNAAKK